MEYTWNKSPRYHVRINKNGESYNKEYTYKNKKYKLEVYDNNGLFLFHVGANGYGDYSTYLKENGISYANERQRLYKIRHAKDLKVKGSKGYYAKKLLWE